MGQTLSEPVVDKVHDRSDCAFPILPTCHLDPFAFTFIHARLLSFKLVAGLQLD